MSMADVLYDHLVTNYPFGAVVKIRAAGESIGLTRDQTNWYTRCLKAENRFHWIIRRGVEPIPVTPERIEMLADRCREAWKRQARRKMDGPVPQCAACQTLGGFVRFGAVRPMRYDGEPYGYSGEICMGCRSKARRGIKVDPERESAVESAPRPRERRSSADAGFILETWPPEEIARRFEMRARRWREQRQGQQGRTGT